MSISIGFNEPVSVFFKPPRNDPFYVKLGCLADELLYFGNRRVSLIVEGKKISLNREQDSTSMYVKNLVIKISLLALSLLPMVYRLKYGVVLPLAILIAKIDYKYGLVKKLSKEVESIESSKGEKAEKLAEKTSKVEKVNKEEAGKEVTTKIEEPKKEKEKTESSAPADASAILGTGDPYEPLRNRLKTAQRILPTEVAEVPSIFWKQRAVELGKSNYRKFLPYDLLKSQHLYVLFVNDHYITMEWQNSRTKKSHTTARVFFKPEMEESSKAIFSIKEKAPTRVITENAPIRLLQYQKEWLPKKKSLLQYPLLVLDHRRKYLIEGAFQPNDELEIWEVAKVTCARIFKEKVSSLENASEEEAGEDVNPGIKGSYADMAKIKGIPLEKHLDKMAAKVESKSFDKGGF